MSDEQPHKSNCTLFEVFLFYVFAETEWWTEITPLGRVPGSARLDYSDKSKEKSSLVITKAISREKLASVISW